MMYNYFSPFFFGPVMMIVYWGLIIWGIILLVRYVSRLTKGTSTRALSILKERYAKGEISRDEFIRMKKELE